MKCSECLGVQCPRGAEYFAKVKDVAAQFKAHPSGITLENLFLTSGIDRNQWYPGHNGDYDMKACTEVLLGSRIVAANSPTRDQPKRQFLGLMSPEEEERTRHTPHR